MGWWVDVRIFNSCLSFCAAFIYCLSSSGPQQPEGKLIWTFATMFSLKILILTHLCQPNYYKHAPGARKKLISRKIEFNRLICVAKCVQFLMAKPHFVRHRIIDSFSNSNLCKIPVNAVGEGCGLGSSSSWSKLRSSRQILCKIRFKFHQTRCCQYPFLITKLVHIVFGVPRSSLLFFHVDTIFGKRYFDR